jgi:hypothetical protein
MITTLCALVAVAAPAPPAARPSPRPRVYTNDDLARIRPFAAETGGASQPAVAPAAAEPDDEPARRSARGEEYWRREKSRTAAKVDTLAQQADTLRRQIAQREKESGARTLSDERLVALRRRLFDTEARARALQAALEERARKAGALPGWLR